MLTDFQNSFTGRLIGKFATNSYLNIQFGNPGAVFVRFTGMVGLCWIPRFVRIWVAVHARLGNTCADTWGGDVTESMVTIRSPFCGYNMI